MTQLHRDSTEANKHTPKGFNNGLTPSAAVKSEQGTSVYDQRNVLTQVISFTDGALPPPTNALGAAFVIIDTGGGAIDAGWSGASYGEWVRSDGAIFWAISPPFGALCNDQNGDWFKYNGVSWDAFGSGGVAPPVLTTRIAHVMPSIGDDATGVVGDLTKPFATINGVAGALVSASSGDTIKVYEDISLEVANLFKVGVNYEFRDGITITKSTAGTVFFLSNTAIPLIIKGRANWVLDTSSKYFMQNNHSTNVYFECQDFTQTLGTTFSLTGSSKKLIVDCNNYLNTGGAATDAVTGTEFIWRFNRFQTNAGNSLTLVGAGAKVLMEGNYMNSTAGYAANILSPGEYTFNVTSIRGFDHAVNVSAANAFVNINGNAYGCNVTGDSTVNVNGTMPFKAFNNPSKINISSGTVNCGVCNADVTVTGGSLDYISTTINTTILRNQGGRVIVKYLSTNSAMASLIASAGITIVKGILTPSVTGNSINVDGGKLFLDCEINYATGVSSNNETPVVVKSGVLFLGTSARINNLLDDGFFCGIRWEGGVIIGNGGTILTAGVGQYPIKAVNAGLQLKVYSGGLNTNRDELGGLLLAKKKKIKFNVISLAVDNLNINGTIHTNTVVSSLAAIATDFLTLVNAGAQNGNVIATQDNIGVDPYFYVEALVAGTDFTFSFIGSALSNEYVRDNSNAITQVITGGDSRIVEDINIE